VIGLLLASISPQQTRTNSIFFLQTKKLSVSEKLIQYIPLKTISDFLGGDHVFLHGKNQLSGGKFVMPVAIAEFIIFSVQ
jgi:hypothetical protein